jgi:hypothetical protein
VRTLLLCLLLGAAAPASAQVAAAPEPAPETLPRWVVPVLRLVSETHVEPTTGIVLSSSGQVLVPSDFAAAGGEVVVLDGGNDIVRHGRPAQLHSAFPELGLKVLTVPGLSRSGAPLAAVPPADDATVRLQAFPPAEQIAEGQPPVSQPATMSVPGGDGMPSIAAATPLPNVTGPLLDDCGNLAGVSLAGGVQTMAPSAATRYVWHGALRQVLEALELPAGGVPCTASDAEETASAAPAPATTEPEQAPVPEPAAADPEPAEIEEPAAPDAGEEPDLNLEVLPPLEDDVAEPEPEAGETAGQEPAAPSWWWLTGGLVLLGCGLAVHRLRRNPGIVAAAPAEMISGTGDGAVPAGPGNADDPKAARPGPQLDSRLVLRGLYSDGRSFEAAAPVSAEAINLEIGRGGADLVLNSAAVSRRHARLNGSRSALTIADLGSRNGTSIDGVPCLEGEIMYLEPGCTVVLGDVRFTISIEPEPGPP